MVVREIHVHLRQGKAHFRAHRFKEALKEFESVLAIEPGNIETRVWIRKTMEELAKPEVTEGEAVGLEEVKVQYCVWMAMGMVAYRVCTNNYDCVNCEFDQEMQKKLAGVTPELEETLARFRALPGSQRICRYGLKGDVSHRLCSRFFQCTICEFGQTMDDALQVKLAQRLIEITARQEALRAKEHSWWWRYWS